MTEVKIIVPGGMFGASASDDILDTAMRVIALAFYKEGDSAWDWPTKYGAKFENDVFFMCPDYQDAECDCGFDKIAEDWHAANPCASSCYHNVRHSRLRAWEQDNNWDEIEAASNCDIFDVNGKIYSTSEEALRHHMAEGGFFGSNRSAKAEAAHEEWCRLYDQKQKVEDRISRALCAEMNIPWNDGCGSAVHCTCGKEENAKTFFAKHDHAERCAIAMPNFWFKPTNFRLTWYKYIGREMEPDGELPADFLQQIFATHPAGKTFEQAFDEFAKREAKSAESFKKMFADLGVQTS